MGDRTFIQATIYDCPPAQARAVYDALLEHRLMSSEDKELLLDDAYTAEEVSLGTAGEIANALVDNAPDATWGMWEDPKYEYLGDLYMFTPSLGLFQAECDANGRALFTAETVLKIVADSLDYSEVKKAVGQAWDEVIGTFQEALGNGYPTVPIDVAEAMYARLTKSGTACSETALCETHLVQAEEFPGDTSAGKDAPVTDHVDASGNEQLACQVCGART